MIPHFTFTMKTLLSLVLSLSSAMAGSYAAAAANSPEDVGRVVDASTFIISKRPSPAATDSILNTLPSLGLADAAAAVDETTDPRKVTKIVDAIYLVNNMKKGHSLEESRDAVSFTTLFPFRRPNSLDIAKLNDIFSFDNPVLHKTYLNTLSFTFRNCGAMPQLIGLRPLIERNVAQCKEKDTALELIDSYALLQTGKPAPEITMTDKDGKAHKLSDYKGRTVVIDVWATWCHNCIKKLPAMLKLRDSYADSGKTVFLTLSIDRRNNHALWKSMSEKHGLTGDNNFIIDSDDTSDFERAYKILGIPRYIVINPDGTIADTFAPAPGDDLKKLIDSTL